MSQRLIAEMMVWLRAHPKLLFQFMNRELFPPHFAAALRDQPRGALIAGMVPQPAQGDAEPVAQADQKIDVGDAPYPPRDGAAQLERSEIDHRLALADLRQAAGVLVTERWGCFATQPLPDAIGDITSLLLGGGRDAGHRLSIGVGNNNGIADREYIGMAWDREVRLHLQTAGAG